MPANLILSFKPGISLIEPSEAQMALQTEQTTLPLQQFSPGLIAAIRILCDQGATEAELSNLVCETDGWLTLPKFHYYLNKFISLGTICHTINGDGFALAIAIPISSSYKFQFTNIVPGKKYTLSRFAYCHQDKDQMILESPLSPTQIVLANWRSGAIVTELVKPQSARELCDKIPGISEDIIQLFLSLLLSVQVLSEVNEDSAIQAEVNDPLTQWEFHDLLFHTRSRAGRHLNPIGKTHRFLDKIQPLPVIKQQVMQERINLYKPDIQTLKNTDYPFTLILEERKSIKSHGNEPITDQQLGEFLYRSARIRALFPKDQMECSNRPYPSGGACYELELYLTVSECDHISAGLYHYCPQQHQLGKLREQDSDVERLLRDAKLASGQQHIPQILIILAARFPRVTWGYESLAYALILKNVGVLYQTMYLVATAMGLAPCALGGGNSDLFAIATETEYYTETSVGEFILGSKPLD